ncbi:MAG TPA: homoserine dehydrogenase, partial [Halobacteriales archaeon]|nr:homoserine dehydrogenase [Halobacteriales archaeon]
MRIAVLGAGAVGRSVAELAGEYGHEVVGVADSTGAVVDDDGIDVEAALASKDETGIVGEADPGDVLEADYDAIVEATPTTLDDAQPGFGHVERALTRDRHVVLANKGPVAERYDDVRALEAESGGRVLFEATVGGAIPVLSTIR